MPTPSEIEIRALFAKHHFNEFVYGWPLTDKKQELADVLVVFADSLIIVQAKMPTVARRGDKLKSWSKKEARAAQSQIGRTWTYIDGGSVRSVANDTFPEQTLAADKLTDVVGIAAVGEEDVDLECVVEVARAGRRIPILTLTLPQLRHVVRAFDTVPDFVRGVNHAAAEVTRIHGKTGARYTTSQSLALLLTYFEPALTEEQRELFSDGRDKARRLWAAFTGPGGMLEERRKQHAAGYLFDSIIEQSRECPAEFGAFHAELGMPADAPRRSQWPTLMTWLARVRRSDRTLLGRTMLKVMEMSSAGRGIAYRIATLPGNDVVVILGGGADRIDRAKALDKVCRAASHVYEARSILGIASDAGDAPSRSFQFVGGVGPSGPIDDVRPLVETIRGMKERGSDVHVVR